MSAYGKYYKHIWPWISYKDQIILDVQENLIVAVGNYEVSEIIDINQNELKCILFVMGDDSESKIFSVRKENRHFSSRPIQICFWFFSYFKLQLRDETCGFRVEPFAISFDK